MIEPTDEFKFVPNYGQVYKENGRQVYWNFAQPTTVNGEMLHEPTIENYYDSINNCYPLEIRRIEIEREVYFIAKWEVAV